MIKDILKIIHRDSSYSKTHISSELGITEELVEDVVFRLITLGYLEEKDLACTGNCRGCYVSNCSQKLFKTYRITEKGNNFLEI